MCGLTENVAEIFGWATGPAGPSVCSTSNPPSQHRPLYVPGRRRRLRTSLGRFFLVWKQAYFTRSAHPQGLVRMNGLIKKRHIAYVTTYARPSIHRRNNLHCTRDERRRAAREVWGGPEPVLPKPKSNATEGWRGHVGCGLAAAHLGIQGY